MNVYKSVVSIIGVMIEIDARYGGSTKEGVIFLFWGGV